MTDTIELHFNAKTLKEFNLPNIAYPVPADLLLEDDGNIPFATLLYYLQCAASDGNTDWRSLSVALLRLTELLAPEDKQVSSSAAGDTWWMALSDIDLSKSEIVTIQRDDILIAAITSCDDGRLNVATYQPLDAKSIAYLISLSTHPHPEHGIAMRENNWQYAKDCCAGTGNVYARDAGEAYLSYWQYGLGITLDGNEIEVWKKQASQSPLLPIMAITELGVHQLEGDAESLTRSLSVPKPSCLNKRQQKRTIRSRFLGCLLGGAVGDALGAPVEFMSRDEIVDRFGSNGIRDYALAYGKLGAITDDTQMTLFTAEGLLRSRVRQILKGLSSPVAQTAYAYQRWLITQGMSSSLSNTARMDDGWLFTINELHSQRAPGYTCLSALQNMSAPERAAQNNSKGCGGVMRVAPAGLFAWQFRKEVSLTDVFELGRDLAALTHGHPTGSLTAGVFTVLVMLLTDGQQLTQALAIAKTCLRNYRDYEETLTAIELAQQLAVEAIPAEQAIQKLGEGWIAEEALAISIYCALMAKTFRQGILMAVNHDGDSDSTGAITGHLLGAMLGTKKIPRHWLENLELYDVIEQVAIDLFEFPNWPLSTYGGDQAFEQMIWKKYPGC